MGREYCRRSSQCRCIRSGFRRVSPLSSSSALECPREEDHDNFWPNTDHLRTAYKLWKQSTPSSSTTYPESTDPTNPVFPSFASPASPVHFELPHRATSDENPVGVVAISAPTAPDPGVAKEADIPPPPAYRERDHPSWDWTDEVSMLNSSSLPSFSDEPD